MADGGARLSERGRMKSSRGEAPDGPSTGRARLLTARLDAAPEPRPGDAVAIGSPEGIGAGCVLAAAS